MTLHLAEAKRASTSSDISWSRPCMVVIGMDVGNGGGLKDLSDGDQTNLSSVPLVLGALEQHFAPFQIIINSFAHIFVCKFIYKCCPVLSEEKSNLQTCAAAAGGRHFHFHCHWRTFSSPCFFTGPTGPTVSCQLKYFLCGPKRIS